MDVIWACSDVAQLPIVDLSNSSTVGVHGIESATYGRVPHSYPHLKIEMVLEVGGFTQTIHALIDTGAEANILLPGLIPSHLWEVAVNPLRFTNANASGLMGGRRVVNSVLQLSGVETEGRKRVKLAFHTIFYDGEIFVQAIVSYQWLAANHLDIRTSRHGISYEDNRMRVFFAGVKPKQVAPVTARLRKKVLLLPLGPPRPRSLVMRGLMRISRCVCSTSARGLVRWGIASESVVGK